MSFRRKVSSRMGKEKGPELGRKHSYFPNQQIKQEKPRLPILRHSVKLTIKLSSKLNCSELGQMMRFHWAPPSKNPHSSPSNPRVIDRRPAEFLPRPCSRIHRSQAAQTSNLSPVLTQACTPHPAGRGKGGRGGVGRKGPGSPDRGFSPRAS